MTTGCYYILYIHKVKELFIFMKFVSRCKFKNNQKLIDRSLLSKAVWNIFFTIANIILIVFFVERVLFWGNSQFDILKTIAIIWDFPISITRKSILNIISEIIYNKYFKYFQWLLCNNFNREHIWNTLKHSWILYTISLWFVY